MWRVVATTLRSPCNKSPRPLQQLSATTLCNSSLQQLSATTTLPIPRGGVCRGGVLLQGMWTVVARKVKELLQRFVA